MNLSQHSDTLVLPLPFPHFLLFTVMFTHILIFLWAYENLLCEYVLMKLFHVRVVPALVYLTCLKSTNLKLVNRIEMNNSE